VLYVYYSRIKILLNRGYKASYARRDAGELYPFFAGDPASVILRLVALSAAEEGASLLCSLICPCSPCSTSKSRVRLSLSVPCRGESTSERSALARGAAECLNTTMSRMLLEMINAPPRER
jgi:hypothetical protein